ncbi:hypothetical protein ACTUVM_003770 [Azotobacter vinelandii]
MPALLSGNPAGAGAITFGSLAAYFDEIGQGKSPRTITTLSGCVPASTVTVARTWIGWLATDAAERAAFAAGFVSTANDIPHASLASNAPPAARPGDQPSPPSGSEPGYLKMREAHLRSQGESSAAAQLEFERIARRIAEQTNDQLLTLLAASDRHIDQQREEMEQLCRDLNESNRKCAKLAEQLREHAGIIEFMNPDNPLSPVEGRRGVSAWCELTENGVGIGELVARWWRSHVGEPPGSVVKHLQWMMAWPDRKKGGMVAKRQHQKG